MTKKIQVEKMAVKLAMEYELSQGRTPKDVSGDKNYIGYDIISGNLEIEVKGRSKDKRPFCLLNENNIMGLEMANDSNYRLYVIMNPLDNPKLIIFNKQDVLNIKSERRQWEIPLRRKNYEGGISLISLIKSKK